MTHVKTSALQLGEKQLTFETGRMAALAQGAVFATYGDTAMLATVGVSDGRPGTDFFPLSVEFVGKFYASGRIKYSKINKREGKLSDAEVLMCRMIDRPLRPMFPKNTRNEVQAIVSLLQTNGINNPSACGINATSMSMLVAGLPLESPVGAVRVGMDDDGNFFLDPTYEQSEKGKLDLLVAGTDDAILMVEAGANMVDNDTMLRAMEWAHDHVKKIVQFQKDFLAEHDITPVELITADHHKDNKTAVHETISSADFDSIAGPTKHHIKGRMTELKDQLMEKYEAQIEDEESEITKGGLAYYFEKGFAASMRRRIFEDGKRIDERKNDEVRQLTCDVTVLPRLHGSALFKRGETQSFTVVTLGSPGEIQYHDEPHRPEYTSQFFHHYNFPPFCVGEVRRLGPTKRREVGHGALGERGLSYVMPTTEEGFPYTVRTTTEILAGNGSTSMAAVCGQTLSLMDAGVPIKAPISGVAMGLMMNDNGDYRILTDIQSFEDFDGDMDFKVIGTGDKITALQMDMKVKGLSMDVLKEAFAAAEKARKHILDAMLNTIPGVRKEMNPHAPRITSFMINPDMIKVVIGKGGETIQGIVADFGVNVDIEDSGLVMITSDNGDSAKGAEEKIRSLVYEPEIGDEFNFCTVKKIMDFGAFIEYMPGKEALMHISQMSKERVHQVTDVMNEGDKVDVRYGGNDPKGRMRLELLKVHK